MTKVLTIKEFASLGGKARWKGKTKKQKSLEMSQIRKAGLDKQASNISNVELGKTSLDNDKQAR